MKISSIFIIFASAGYSKDNLLSAGIPHFPHSFQPTTHGTQMGGGESAPSSKTSAKTKTSGMKLEKSNILLLGPTGCGE